MSDIPKFSKGMTYSETLGPAMEITDRKLADLYFDALVKFTMEEWGKTREQCEASIRSNLGYYAGYYSNETRARVELLFRCSHPLFGSFAEKGAPTAEEAFEAGKKLGEESKRKANG